VRDRPAADVIPGWRKVEALVPVSDAPAVAGRGPTSVSVPLDLDDRELWLSVSAVRFSEGTVYAFRDLTEERRLEEMRSDIVATVSHELRTPLASIHGAAVTLRQREGGLDEATRDDLLGIVADQSNRLARLADEILLASQIGLGSATIREEPLDPVELARGVVDAARVHVGPRLSIVLRSRAHPPAVLADGDKLRQVLGNLVENAIKYSPAGGRVELAVEGRDGHVRFAVADEGIGIPAREHERIFEKFYRLDPQLSRGVGGSGLGLYISRELLRYMGGQIWVESEPGRGSTFFIELRAAQGDVKAA
jgi:two-component system phosphate regulon sensor histidine kinase PhoR